MPLAGIEPARGMRGIFAWFAKVHLFGCPKIRAGSDRLKKTRPRQFCRA